jgi:membrane-associated protein
MLEWLHFLNPDFLLSSLKAFSPVLLSLILFGIIFAESGLFFGFFLPGDSLLFTAGLFSAQGKIGIELIPLIIIFFLAAVTGDSAGYAFGQYFGRRFFNQPTSVFRNPEHLNKAEAFYSKYGKRTIILARFVPAVRTFAPIAAGVSSMNYRTFILFNLAGATLWAIGICLLGYFLGKVIPSIDKYIIPLLLVIILLSIIQPLRELLGSKARRQAFKTTLKSLFGHV